MTALHKKFAECAQKILELSYRDGESFPDGNEVITEAESCFYSRSSDFHEGLFHGYEKCMAIGSQYLEKKVSEWNFRSLVLLDHGEHFLGLSWYYIYE